MNCGPFACPGGGSCSQGGQGGAGADAPASAPPSLSICNNSDKGPLQAGPSPSSPSLPGPRKKQAEALFQNLLFLAREFGLNCLGFLTLTVGDWVNGRFVQVFDRKEAERRFDNLRRRVLKRYRCGVVVPERHASGAVHFHLVVALAGPAHLVAAPVDIRTGFNFEEFLRLRGLKRRFRAEQVGACAALVAEWKELRRVLPGYGFGRSELTPIRSNAVGIGRYMGEYLIKDWLARLPEDHGMRGIRYLGHWSSRPQNGARRSRPCMGVFGWATPKARAWRAMLAQMAVVVEAREKLKLTPENIAQKWGKRWAWRFNKAVQGIQFVAEDSMPPALQDAIHTHNCGVIISCGEAARHVTQAGSDSYSGAGWERQEVLSERDAILYRAAWSARDERIQQADELREVAQEFQNQPF